MNSSSFGKYGGISILDTSLIVEKIMIAHTIALLAVFQ